MRSFEFARKIVDGKVVMEPDEKGVVGEVLAYPKAQIPEYATEHSAGADFYCAEEVVIPSIWHAVFGVVSEWSSHVFKGLSNAVLGKGFEEDVRDSISKKFSPTIVHTGIKSEMEPDEVLELYNRSSNPKNLGLILANGVGVVDSDFYNNETDDGEIRFAFFNFKPWNVTLKVGDKIGQGVFKKYLRPVKGLRIREVKREGGFGSTNNQ